MNTRNALLSPLLLSLTIGCGSVKTPAADVEADAQAAEDPAPSSYQTTSNEGDLSTWTIDGNELSVIWKDIAPVTGAIERIYTVHAICGSIDSTFGDRTCLVDGDAGCEGVTGSCVDDPGPANGDTFTVFEVPGIALIANVEDSDLHAGFAAGDCSDLPTDDYSFINIGLGQEDVFGVFRTDSNFDEVVHMDFGFSPDPVNQIAYTTNDPGGIQSGITAGACVDGVRELVIDETNDIVRLIMTAAGHFIIDKPEGEGGLIAMSSQNVAVAEDFANRSFGGISFPDDRAPELLNVTTGAVTNGKVEILSIELSDSGVLPLDTPVFINSASVGPTLSAALLEPKNPYASNKLVIDGSYAGGPTDIPGLFELDAVSGDETAIIGVGAHFGGKTMLFGSVVNQLEQGENGVKGNFILIEK